MKNKFLVITIIFLSVSLGKYFAQSKFNVDYDEIKGKLTETDKYKKDFGRYHGYELPMYEGETANFALYSSDFNPRIILVNPDGKVFKESNQPTNGLTTIITQVPTSGDWILYVVGDQKDQGQFVLRYAFADANSINVSSNMDFCSTINFLVAHANAHFMMLQVTGSTKNGLPKLPGTKESFIDDGSGAFVNIISVVNEKEVKQIFENYTNQINNCLPDWKSIKDNDASSYKIQNEDKIKIELEYNPIKNQTDNYEIILRISK